MNECYICNPDKELIIMETDRVRAIYHPDEIKRGHIIITPKKHKELFTDLTPEEVSELMILTLSIAKAIVPFLSPEKYYLVSVGDRHPHFHLHLLPKMESEESLGPYVFT